MTSNGSTTPTVADRPAPSIRRGFPPGSVVMVTLDATIARPLIVTSARRRDPQDPESDQLLSGPILVEPGDYLLDAFRTTAMEGRILSRRIDGIVFWAFGERLAPGQVVGTWRLRDGRDS